MDGWFIRLTVHLKFDNVFWVHYRIKLLCWSTADTVDQKITCSNSSCFGPFWHTLCLQQTGRRGRKAQADRAKGGGAGRAPRHGRINGHHQENGMETMSLFEVVKLGKSATQVGEHSVGGLYPRSLFLVIRTVEMISILFFSLLLMTGLRHIKMIATSPFWTWLISLFSALVVKVSNDFILFCFG